MFKALAEPTKIEPVGKYAIRFIWNDGHEHGIYSWEYLREHCPCAECKAQARHGSACAGASRIERIAQLSATWRQLRMQRAPGPKYPDILLDPQHSRENASC